MPVLDGLLTEIGLVLPGATPARKRLEFPLSAAAEALFDAAIVADSPIDRPDDLVLAFTLTDPAGPRPPVLPFFPGKLFFEADDLAGIPDPAVAPADFDWTAVDAWPTTGRIRVELDVKAIETKLTTLGVAFPLIPDRAWYWPVTLPPTLLTAAALTAFAPRTPVKRASGAAIGVGTTRWAQHALAGFLAGSHPLPLVQHASDPTKDTIRRQPLPVVQADGVTGEGELHVAFARRVAIDDAAAAEVTAAAGAAPVDSADHPLNAPLPVRRVLQAAKAELDLTGALAATTVADWPGGPRWFSVRVATPGRPATPPYILGALAEQTAEVRVGADVLQQRAVPVHGMLSVQQAGADPVPAAPTLSIDLSTGPLRIVETNAEDPGDPAKLEVDAAALPDSAWAALLPPIDTSKAAIAARCAAITDSRRSQRAVTEYLLEYAKRIRPTTWNGDPTAGAAFDEIFHGSRRPWLTINQLDLTRLLDAMDLVSFPDPAAPVVPRRPSFALLLWLMEGLESQKRFRVLAPGWKTLASVGLPGRVTWAPADLKAASNGTIRTAVRTLLFWAYFGLDQYAWSLHRGADNKPSMGSEPIADTIAGHNAGYAARDADVRAAGILPPTVADMNAQISTRQNPAGSGNWEFRLGADFMQTVLAAQYAEYLRRVAQLPTAAQDYASFTYIAYNGNPASATPFFNAADAVIAADPVAWAGKTHEDVLLSRRLAGTEVTRGSGTNRSVHPKVQALHVAALWNAWGRHLPNVWR